MMQFGGDGSGESPYADCPQPIGWNTTISAPGMHAETLRHLIDKLISASCILDIGTGSGFMTACMAQLAPDNAVVYGVDHIKEINDFARRNIMSICPHLFKKKKIQLVTQDGRKGLRSYGERKSLEYDVIHVGGQLNEVDEDEEGESAKAYVVRSENAARGAGAQDPDDQRKIRIDKDLLNQMAPGGTMYLCTALVAGITF